MYLWCSALGTRRPWGTRRPCFFHEFALLASQHPRVRCYPENYNRLVEWTENE